MEHVGSAICPETAAKMQIKFRYCVFDTSGTRSCWPACRRGRAGLIHVGFLVDRGALKTIFLPLLLCPALIVIPPIPHTHTSFVYHKC